MNPKHLRSLAILVLVIVTGLYVINLLIDNPYTHRIVRGRIHEAVKEYSEIQMDYKSLKVGLLPPGVDLYNLQIKHPEFPDQALLSLGQIRLRLSLIGLLFGEIRFGLVEFFDADFNYPLPVEIDKIFKSKPKQEPTPKDAESKFTWPPDFDLPVDTLRIRNLKTFVKIPEDEDSAQDPKEDLLVLALQGFNLEFNFYSWSESQIWVDANSVTLDLPSEGIQPLDDSKIYWRANLNKRGLASRELKIENKWYKLNGNLGAEFFQNPDQRNILDRIQLRGDVELEGNFAAIGSLLKIDDTSGNMSGNSLITVDIPINESGKTKFAINAKAKLKDAKLSGFGLLDSEADLKISKTGIEFQRISILDDELNYGEARGELFFKKPMNYSFYLNAQSLPLVKLLSALKVDLTALDTNLSGEEISIKGTGKPFRLTTDGVLQMENFKSPIFEKRATRFKIGPSFRFPLKLEVDENKLIIPRVNGLAFFQSSPSRHLLSENIIKAPEGSTLISPTNLGGVFHFDEGKGMEMTLESENFQLGLANYFTQFTMSGNTKLKTTVFGPYNNIRAKTDLLSTDIGIGFMKLSLLEIQGDFYPDSFRWNTLKLRTPQKEDAVFENGKVFFDENLSVELKGSIQNFNPETLQHIQDTFLFHESKKANFKTRIARADLELKGPLLKPLAMQGNIDCKMHDGFLGDNSLWTELNFTAAHSSDDIWNFSQIDYLHKNLKISANLKQEFRNEKPKHSSSYFFLKPLWDTLEPLGWSNHELKGEFKISTWNTNSKSEANALNGIPFLNQIFKNLSIQSSMQGEGKFSGPKENLQVLANLGLNKLEVFGSKLSPVSNKIFLQDNKLEWISIQGGSAFQSRLNLNMESISYPYTWNIEAKRWDVRFLAPTKIFHADPRNYAYLSSSIDLNGNFADFANSTKGKIGLDDFRLHFQRNVDTQSRVLDLALKKPVVFISSDSNWILQDSQKLELDGEKLKLSVSTSNRNSLSKQIDLKIDGFFSLDILRDFTPMIESTSGSIIFDGRILGTIQNLKPVISFRTEAENSTLNNLTSNKQELSEDLGTSIGITDLRPAFRKIQLDAQLNGRELILRKFVALKGNGRVTLNGHVNLGELQAPDTLLTIKTEDVSVIYPIAVFKSFDTNVTSLLTLTGKSFPYSLGGDIQIVKARSYREFDIRDEIVEALRRRSIAVDPLQRDAYVKLDLRIRADESIAVSNKNFQTVASTNLVIQGSDTQPDIKGQIEINRGKFEYKRSFTIEQGIISFDDPVKPDPRLNITGYSEVSGYRVQVTISGRASNPKVDLSIDPPTKDGGSIINEIDILVLLSTGQLPSSDRQFGDSQAAATAEALNIVAGQLEKPVEELFELSGQKVVRQVYIDTSEVEGRAVPRFNVPVNVGENVSVVFRVVNQSNWKISSEYAVHESISLSGSLDGKRAEETGNNSTISKAPADTSVDLKFRFAFP